MRRLPLSKEAVLQVILFTVILLTLGGCQLYRGIRQFDELGDASKNNPNYEKSR